MRTAFKRGDIDLYLQKKWKLLMKKSSIGREACFYFQQEMLAGTISMK